MSAYADTPLSAEQIRANVARMLAARQTEIARVAPRKPKKRRPHSKLTRQRQSRAAFANAKVRALEAGEVSPLRRLRLHLDLTAKQAARLALIDERTFRRAEKHPESISATTWARIAQAFDAPISDLLPPQE
jgi:DNA-binding XRE family transcriptional regulator